MRVSLSHALRCGAALLIGAGVSGASSAATYTVGAGGDYPHLNALFAGEDLEPGDVVEVQGGATYAGDIVMPASDGGAPGNPVLLRGVGATRPHLSGGTNTIEFRLSNHVVMERFEISGSVAANTFRCVYHHAHDIVLRDLLVRDCPRHGVLGADTDSGSLTIEYSELRNAGSGGGNHLVYMATDEVAHPGAVFRLRHSYLHDSDFTDGAGIGGNLVKSRAERNEIHYNWLEGAHYHELELIGPDPDGAPGGWSEALVREDSDIVGNVIVHTEAFGAILRFGGDATGQSQGRYRFVNNTVIRRGTGATTVFRLFDGIDSLEFHNNVIWHEGGGAMTLVRALEAAWLSTPKVSGSNNWISSGHVFNPPGLTRSLTGTITGASPGLVDPAGGDLSPAAGSPLLGAANPTPSAGADYAIATPLFPPQWHPPARAWLAPGSASPRPMAAALDIGAIEREDPSRILADGFEG